MKIGRVIDIDIEPDRQLERVLYNVHRDRKRTRYTDRKRQTERNRK